MHTQMHLHAHVSTYIYMQYMHIDSSSLCRCFCKYDSEGLGSLRLFIQRPELSNSQAGFLIFPLTSCCLES